MTQIILGFILYCILELTFLEDLASKIERVRGWYSSTIEQVHQVDISLSQEKTHLFRSASRWHANSHFR